MPRDGSMILSDVRSMDDAKVALTEAPSPTNGQMVERPLSAPFGRVRRIAETGLAEENCLS
jgi:hypothetical protein